MPYFSTRRKPACQCVRGGEMGAVRVIVAGCLRVWLHACLSSFCRRQDLYCSYPLHTTHAPSTPHSRALTRRSLPRTSNNTLPPRLPRKVAEAAGSRCNARAARKHVEADALAEEQLARLAAHNRDLGLGARGDHGAFGEEPLHAAVLVRGVRVLGVVLKKRNTYVHPQYLKTSSKKGTPARTPCVLVCVTRGGERRGGDVSLFWVGRSRSVC
jgi:hypothetical protein